MAPPAVTLDELRPQLVCHVFDEELGHLGWVVIDRALPRSPAGGGIRLSHDLTVDEVADNARAMTLKWSFLNIPHGGAKAGIGVSPELLEQRRSDVMAAFGRGIRPLVDSGIYFTGADLGTTLDDVNAVRRALGKSPQVDAHAAGGLPTALTVVETAKRWALQSGLDLAGASVAVEGFGKVGARVAELLAELGARIVAVSVEPGALHDPHGLDLARLLDLRRAGDQEVLAGYGGGRIDRDELLTLPVDILLPCARSWTISNANVESVGARAIIPSANAAVTRDAEAALTRRGITVIPDFVASGGGVLYGQMVNVGFGLGEFRETVENVFAAKVDRLLRRAAASSASVGDVAREAAWNSFRRRAADLAARPEGGMALRRDQLRRHGVLSVPGKVAERLNAKGRWRTVTGPLALARFAEGLSADTMEADES